MDRVSTELILRVYNDDEGVHVEVGPGEEGCNVEIRTTDESSKKWFGDVQLVVSKAMEKNWLKQLKWLLQRWRVNHGEREYKQG